MMGERRVDQGSLFYEFSLKRHFAYADNYLIDLDYGIIVDVEPWRPSGLRATSGGGVDRSPEIRERPMDVLRGSC